MTLQARLTLKQQAAGTVNHFIRRHSLCLHCMHPELYTVSDTADFDSAFSVVGMVVEYIAGC